MRSRSIIKRDLEEIIAILKGSASDSKLEDHAMMVSCWTKEVRELSYDIEDFVDQYEHAVVARSRSGPTPRRKMTRRPRSKTTPLGLHEKLRRRLWMANKLREFSLRTQEALQRHGIYSLGGISGTAFSSTSTDVSSSSSWHTAPFEDDDVHVGIDLSMNKLEEWLTTVQDGEQQKLNVVSIVGFGGVGKTTLANKLYQKIGWQFECRAFLRTSRKPDMRKIFISMLSQVRPHQPPDNWKVHSLISSIRTHLQDKRYLIVIDNLWATSTWDIIKCALPDGNNCSRILITTEIEDLAMQSPGIDSKYVFKMKPLSEDDSRKLFFSTLFGPQGTCPPELRDASYEIIRRCGGLPLAIVTIASVLASQMGRQDQWGYVNKSLGCSLMTNRTFDGLKDILSLSYYNLPQHLKACLLYMSLYQDDNIIWKDDLVNQWIAEGFFCATEGQDKQEISRAYFDELVSRKMILPVDRNDNGEVLSCVVHHMVLDLIITYKSLSENFVTAIHHSQATTTTLADKVRRLSLHFGNAEDAMPPTNMRLSQVRTLAFFGVFKCMPSIVEFRLLQVLILHFWGDNDSIILDLTRITELFRLRYLKVSSNVTLELQTQMRGLQSLETLTIDARISAVPTDIVHLPGLLHLKLPAETNLPSGIGQVTSLRTLGYFDLIGNSLENLQSLSKLTNLQDLQLACCTAQEPENVKDKMELLLGSILGELRNLRSLTVVRVVSYGNSLDAAGATSMRATASSDGFSSVFFPLTLLESCRFSQRIWIFSCLPKCFGQPNLRILKIGLNKIVRDDVDVLRGLPALAVLSLYVHTKPAERIVIGKVGFSVLKYFKFKCCDPWLKFEVEAMPNLRKLELGFNAHRADHSSTIPVGIEHLTSLKEVWAKIGGAGSEVSHRKAAELALRDAIGVDARCLRVTIECVNQTIGCTENQSSITREAEYGCSEQHEIDEDDFDQLDEYVEEESDEDYGEIVDSKLPLLLPSTPPGAATSAAAQDIRKGRSRGGGSSSVASVTQAPQGEYRPSSEESAPAAAAKVQQEEEETLTKELQQPSKNLVPRRQYRGVRMRKWGKWVAEIREPHKRTRIWLGSYSTPVAAARAYDTAVFYLRGRSARLNFPDEIPALELPEGETRGPDGGTLLSAASIRKKAIEVGSRVDALHTGMMVRPHGEQQKQHHHLPQLQQQYAEKQPAAWSGRAWASSPESSDDDAVDALQTGTIAPPREAEVTPPRQSPLQRPAKRMAAWRSGANNPDVPWAEWAPCPVSSDTE
ncbi:putative late blight resistance protein-like protein R1B-17 [Dichanthelium oligosanthes]|uniref:Putative late blight resistance protein-like protein R1B-17 n=1 Tax=Dichanthelium oligosanthes TaxID=888268 RepID=A0A1E5UY60_9POAL|nr:putative late blight resistance protein-like protein R1B-17 [Dichanthelium oligosanthes]